ncbi:MAG: PD-(D/E)XK nuclease family protein [Sandaracinaceae bacterium]
MTREQLALAALASAALALAVLWVRAEGRHRARRRRHRRRTETARRGERDAEALLRQRGFRIEARQVAGSVLYRVDGAEREGAVRADLLVRRGRRRYVAEVKTGERAVRPTHPDTRRQLLEYQLAFAVDGLLLVAPEQGTVRRVEVPRPRAPGAPPSWAAGLAGLAVLGAALWWLVRSLGGRW